MTHYGKYKLDKGGGALLNDSQRKKIKALVKKYPDSCSICRVHYDDDCMTYTVFGYDKNGKMQVTTECCADKIIKPVLLGLSGYYDPDEFDERIKHHPMAKSFFD